MSRTLLIHLKNGVLLRSSQVVDDEPGYLKEAAEYLSGLDFMFFNLATGSSAVVPVQNIGYLEYVTAD